MLILRSVALASRINAAPRVAQAPRGFSFGSGFKISPLFTGIFIRILQIQEYKMFHHGLILRYN